MDERDRSRSPMAPVVAPVFVSNSNAEEMDGTENFEDFERRSAVPRSSERREVRPGSGRRAEVGVIGSRTTRSMQLLQQPRLQHMQPTAATIGSRRPGMMGQGGTSMSQGTGHVPSSSSSSSAPPPLPHSVTVSRREWYEYTVARTSTVATLNAATGLARAIASFVAAAAGPAAAQPFDAAAEMLPHTVRALAAAAAADRVLQRPSVQQPSAAAAPPPATPGAVLTALAKARIGASERLKAIAASLNDRPPTRTNVPQDARNEAIQRIRAELVNITDPSEREEASRMLDRILAPGSLSSVRSLYQQLPVWEENAPPPQGWPFRLPGQRAAMQQRQSANAVGGSVSREREYTRESRRRNRQAAAYDAARDLFEELLANGMMHPTPSGVIPRLPRPSPDLLPSYELLQLRDLPTMLTVQQTRVPPDYRIEEPEEHVVPTGPGMRSTHVVPVINSQTHIRENFEFEYRRRAGNMMHDALENRRQWARVDEQARSAMDRGEQPPPRGDRPPRPPAQRPTDTPHPGFIVRAAGEDDVPMSPLLLNLPNETRERFGQVERETRRQKQRQLLRSQDPAQRRLLGQPSSPSDSTVSLAGDSTDNDDLMDEPGPSTRQSSLQTAMPPTAQEGKIVVHRLRPRSYRAPGQRKESNGLIGGRRLILEHKELVEKGGVERVEAAPKPENIRTWTAVVEGAEGSQFEGGVFFFDITFPKSYPMGKINIACLTHIVHPFVMRSGMVDIEAVAKLCFDVNRFSEMKYGGVEKSLMIAAALVSGKLPVDTPEKTKQLIERGRVFTARYAC